MAGKGADKNDKKVQKIINKEKDRKEKKQKLVGDAKWMPAKGSGMMTEKNWRKYSPNSKTLVDYKD